MTTRTKYQIFVSSTFEDLKEERELVIKAILEMGHIPVGMEMFSAGDDEQWKLIRHQIDDCDYYVVIAAHQYGSVDKNVSYTEKEYDYATLKGIPTLGFVISPSAEWPFGKRDTNKKTKASLDAFKSKIKKKYISYWVNKEDLYGKVSISLMKQFNTNPGTGWMRANEGAGPKVLLELSRLSCENSMLREQLQEMADRVSKETSNEQEKIINILKKHKVAISFMDSRDCEETTDFSLLSIFKLVAPELIAEKSTRETAVYLGEMLNLKKDRIMRKYYPIPDNTMKNTFIDLMILNLVKPSGKRISDKNEYWIITDEGTAIFKVIRWAVLEDENAGMPTKQKASEMQKAIAKESIEGNLS